MIHFYPPDFELIFPELIIVISSLCLLMGGIFREKSRFSEVRTSGQLAIISLLIALCVLIFQYTPGTQLVTFEGLIIQDDFIYFSKILILAGSAAVLAISLPSMVTEQMEFFEFPPLAFLAGWCENHSSACPPPFAQGGGSIACGRQNQSRLGDCCAVEYHS